MWDESGWGVLHLGAPNMHGARAGFGSTSQLAIATATGIMGFPAPSGATVPPEQLFNLSAFKL